MARGCWALWVAWCGGDLRVGIELERKFVINLGAVVDRPDPDAGGAFPDHLGCMDAYGGEGPYSDDEAPVALLLKNAAQDAEELGERINALYEYHKSSDIMLDIASTARILHEAANAHASRGEPVMMPLKLMIERTGAATKTHMNVGAIKDWLAKKSSGDASSSSIPPSSTGAVDGSAEGIPDTILCPGCDKWLLAGEQYRTHRGGKEIPRCVRRKQRKETRKRRSRHAAGSSNDPTHTYSELPNIEEGEDESQSTFSQWGALGDETEREALAMPASSLEERGEAHASHLVHTTAALTNRRRPGELKGTTVGSGADLVLYRSGLSLNDARSAPACVMPRAAVGEVAQFECSPSDHAMLGPTRDYLLCQGCGISGLELGRALQTCSRCRAAHYCSRACQQASWNHHRFECGRRREIAAQLWSASGHFGIDFTQWVRCHHAELAALALRLLVADAPPQSKHKIVWVQMHYEPAARVFCAHACRSLPIEDAQTELGAPTPDLGALLAAPVHGSRAGGRRVWALIVATSTCKGENVVRIVPQCWTPENSIALSSPEWLTRVPQVGPVLEALKWCRPRSEGTPP